MSGFVILKVVVLLIRQLVTVLHASQIKKIHSKLVFIDKELDFEELEQ
jgi:hypothetical protein